MWGNSAVSGSGTLASSSTVGSAGVWISSAVWRALQAGVDLSGIAILGD
jgi:hypothetical protein